MKTPLTAFFALALMFIAPAFAEPVSPAPIDKNATAETQNLFRNMMRIAPKTVMFGHQNTLAYGYSWRDEGDAPDRSDVKDVEATFQPSMAGT